MKYEELINELCDVIKESENNADLIYDNTQYIQNFIENLDLTTHEKNKINDKLSDIFGLLQHQDLHRQKIERVVNFVCEKNGLDKSKYNFANSAKNINNIEDNMSQNELDELIKQMQL